MADPRMFLTLEQSLSARLKKNWKKMAAPMSKRIAKALVEKDYDKATKELYTLNMARVYKGESKYIEYITNAILLFGVENATDLQNSAMLQQGAGLSIKYPAIKQFKHLVSDTTNTILKAGTKIIAGMDLVHRRLAEGGGIRKDTGEDIWDNLFPEDINIEDVTLEELQALLVGVLTIALEDSGDALIDITSSLFTSRLASYGFLLEAQLMGASRYTINEVLDGRTCPVCEQMHGKSFEVRPNLQRQDDILNTTDPEELKSKAPWPKQDKESVDQLAGMSEDDLQSLGFSTPPYHPLCRGIIVYKVD